MDTAPLLSSLTASLVYHNFRQPAIENPLTSSLMPLDALRAADDIRARTRANRDLSAARMAARATLADQRQKIADETFAEARSQLVAFVAGDKYAAWLQNEAAALAEALGENANIAARPADPTFRRTALSVVSTPASVSARYRFFHLRTLRSLARCIWLISYRGYCLPLYSMFLACSSCRLSSVHAGGSPSSGNTAKKV